MRVVTWNVNSVIARCEILTGWLAKHKPDVVCLQETKCVDDKFPVSQIEELGYQLALFGQAAYNGVAVLSRHPIEIIRRGLPNDAEDAQKRLVDVRTADVRIINVYVPNGEKVGSAKYAFKLEWFAKLRQYLDEHCQPDDNLILCGDFNVAPEAIDVHDPMLWEGRIMFSEPERNALRHVQQWGLADLFRQHHDQAGLFTWWDYRAGAFRRNQGLRIDHVFGTKSMASRCVGAEIERTVRSLERPSDHAPVVAEFL